MVRLSKIANMMNYLGKEKEDVTKIFLYLIGDEYGKVTYTLGKEYLVVEEWWEHPHNGSIEGYKQRNDIIIDDQSDSLYKHFYAQCLKKERETILDKMAAEHLNFVYGIEPYNEG